jgi:hypothetical protein
MADMGTYVLKETGRSPSLDPLKLLMRVETKKPNLTCTGGRKDNIYYVNET